eukprot:SAG31_NODE_3998_length_3677_cov_10.286193_6_plen_60_part_00
MVVCDALGKDWTDELAWVTKLGPDNPKNYQIWNYRKQCVKRCNQVLRVDAETSLNCSSS